MPSPRLASAQEASTTIWPSAARRSRPPASDGATASPMGRKRALTNTAASAAAPAPPPAPRIEAAANCADPDSTSSEQAIGAATPQPSWRASTPNDTPSTTVAIANGSPARAPAA